MAMVLVAFLVIGMALPILPLHVHAELGFGTTVVGLVTGSQFAASLVSRFFSGRLCDERGPKRAVLLGLAGATLAGVLYMLSLAFASVPVVALAVLLAGRAVLGAAESFIITGATVWGLARVGPQCAGKVISWMGTAMFAAFAGGAPLGVSLYDRGGFGAVAAATAILPLATMVLASALPSVPAVGRSGTGILYVVRKIWMPGLGAALSSIGFGVILTFGSLLFVANGWTPVWLAFSSYAVALILARLLFGHLPDRVGGARVALVGLVIEAGGLVLMGIAASAVSAALGAALLGFGYALVFPGLGVEAVRRAPPDSHGVAMGAYTACLDLALGLSGPVLGLLASQTSLRIVFLVTAVIVIAATPFAG